ncbi:MAG: DoxX family protein [Vicinamibacterales bacterium]
MTPATDRAWAIFVARAILGIVFFVAGIYKVFMWGPVEHARDLFVVPYAATFLPVWSLWATGTAVPVLELITGGLVLIGLWTRPSLFVLGGILILVAFGHLLIQPSTSINSFILPRSALLLIVLLVPRDADRLSLDYLLWSRKRVPGSNPA